MRPVPAVVFDVQVESDDHTDAEVMRRIFAHSPAIHLRAMSPLVYQSGSYERTLSDPEVWTGRLERIRIDPVSNVRQAADGSFHFVDERTSIPTSQATTYYAFATDARLLVYWDTAAIPYTRLTSYVSGAIQEAARHGFNARCEIVPRTIFRPLRDWLDHFTTIERVRVQLRHSQSPGNQAIDSILEQLNAHSVTETIEAAPTEKLNKTALLNPTLPIGQALDHLEKASKNGEATIFGHVGSTPITFNTRSPVERHMFEVEEDVSSMRSTFARFAARLLSIASKS